MMVGHFSERVLEKYINESLANSSYWNSDTENYPLCHNAVTFPNFYSSVLSCVNTLPNLSAQKGAF